MARYRVHAIDTAGKLVLHRIDAASAEEARRTVARAGTEVLRVDAAGPVWSWRGRGFDVRLFAHELMTLLRAGLSLVEALETLESRNAVQPVSDDGVVGRLLATLRQGESLSAAMERMGDVFPPLLTSTVSASEQTGDVAHGLQRYLRHDEQTTRLRDKVVSASLYPAMLMISGLAVALFLLVFLVPRFSSVYENLDSELPLASRLLMQWGIFAADNLSLVLATLAALVVLGVGALLRKSARDSVLARIETIRWLGERVRLMRLSRFYRALGLLLEGGIPAVRALRITARLLPDGMHSGIHQAIRDVERGRPLSESLEDARLSTPVASRLLRAGERNGQLADMLERTAEFHDEEVARWLDAFMRLFEPALMIFIGLVVGMIVVLLYLPIFELAGSLQ